MKIKFLNECDFVNYKKPSMFIGFPSCNWKCERECGRSGMCQNAALAKEPDITIGVVELVERYFSNSITSAIVCGGLEPMDSWKELQNLIVYVRHYSLDDIVIYTGYKEEEIQDKIEWLCLYENVIVKFGRFIPDNEPHFDEVLGVNLASDNQYAKYVGDRV